MALLIRLLVILFLVSCSGDTERNNILYGFPSLSQGQLVDLRNRSETIEGFFITTDLSDLDSSWEERGFYLYVCIRFLNDAGVNQKLNNSAIPLLIQVSTHKDQPTAESVVLLHPETEDTFYYEERKHFQLAESPILIKDTEYHIFDVLFNEKGKITNISFLKAGVTLEDLKNAEEDTDEDEDSNNGEEETDENEEVDTELKKKDVLLEVTAFAKQSSVSCQNWSLLNYNHSDQVPDYLQTNYSRGQNSGDAGNSGSSGTGSNSGIRDVSLIPEDAEYKPVPQN